MRKIMYVSTRYLEAIHFRPWINDSQNKKMLQKRWYENGFKDHCQVINIITGQVRVRFAYRELLTINT